jgi:UDP-N-acetylmuramoylalanine--D-glutamate ligase
MVLSPGVDIANSSAIKYSRELVIPWVGEIELSFWLTEAKIIAITGTNGKTTTTHLTHQVLSKNKKRVFLGGNIGTPFSSFVLKTKKNDLIVLELSSFQLESILKFHPYVAAFLNIEPDHLDRYKDLKDYLDAKLNIFKNQDDDDWAVINKNINFRPKVESAIRSKKVYFSDEFSNENFSCVYKIASLFNLSKIDCLKVFSSFKGFAHRLQFTRNINGVDFINDSKATNPSSTVWALRNTKAPVILIAGGKDKGLDYSSILPYSNRIKKINLVGEASGKIKKALNTDKKIEIFSSLKAAVAASYKEASGGDTVLFSPMCSSFDMFRDYEERGDKFMTIVTGLRPDKR